MFRKFDKLLLFLVWAWLAAELTAWTGLTRFRGRILFREPSQNTLTLAEIAEQARIFDPALGWTEKFPNPLDERPRTANYGANYAVTYGGSFTLGAESEDGETWQAKLQSKVRSNVLNFGVNAYGIDQATLRYESLAERVPARYAILAINHYAVNSSMTIYRNFIRTHDNGKGITLTKPRFDLSSGHLVLIPNPVQGVAELSRLHDPQFIAGLERLDWWRQTFTYPTFEFPFVRTLFEESLWEQLPYDPRYNAWTDPVRMEMQAALFQRFAAAACRNGQIPLILLYPDRGILLDGGQPPKPKDERILTEIAAQFAEQCGKYRRTCLFPYASFRDSPSLDALFARPEAASHYNSAGNEVIASEIYRLTGPIDRKYERSRSETLAEYCGEAPRP